MKNSSIKENRFQENNESRWSISFPTINDPTLVICPNCKNKAAVIVRDEVAKLSCAHCGYHKTTLANKCSFAWGAITPTDGFFGAELWLQTDCSGNSLWAFNRRHLQILENFVMAKHRQRNPTAVTWHNSSLMSRLPKWIKSAKNRQQVLKNIEVLKSKLRD